MKKVATTVIPVKGKSPSAKTIKKVPKKLAMHFHVVSLFPESMTGYLASSIVGRALVDGLVKVDYYNPRDFTPDKNRRVDRRPYGGGPGMVLEAESLLRAIDKAKGRKKSVKVLILSPGGKPFTNSYARELAGKFKDIILVSGRYEGIDARVKRVAKADEVTVGPYVLTGGELPAMIIIDATARQIPGVLGDFDSLEDDRVASSEVYTRPEVLVYKKKNYRVPKVLLEGNHKLIEAWKEGRTAVAKQAKRAPKKRTEVPLPLDQFPNE